mmetsp:Transcript_9789/g.28747  ORF Transcript_9789/g.28747 Transcript_9789/m.28747 type:complete len:222 (+) Transcript_9789:1294-1959(+)
MPSLVSEARMYNLVAIISLPLQFVKAASNISSPKWAVAHPCHLKNGGLDAFLASALTAACSAFPADDYQAMPASEAAMGGFSASVPVPEGIASMSRLPRAVVPPASPCFRGSVVQHRGDVIEHGGTGGACSGNTHGGSPVGGRAFTARHCGAKVQDGDLLIEAPSLSDVTFTGGTQTGSERANARRKVIGECRFLCATSRQHLGYLRIPLRRLHLVFRIVF